MSTDVARVDRPRAMILADALDQENKQRALLKEFVEKHMQDGTDYGVIPGTKNKTLLKPGAEKLTQLFRCTPRYKIEEKTEDWTSGLFYYRFSCQVVTQADEVVVAEGVGSCSSYESKYRWRTQDRSCPSCGAAAIKRSKFPPREDPTADPGWYCYSKMGGCGANFSASDPAILDQQTGRVQNPDLADVANTVLKMAKKRSLVDAAIALARCSDIFTQDLEPEDDHGHGDAKEPPRQTAAPRQASQPAPRTNGVTVWTLDEAVAECKEAGISREELMEHLRKTGSGTYKKQQHTALVRALILAKKTGAKPVAAELPDDDFDDEPPRSSDDDITY